MVPYALDHIFFNFIDAIHMPLKPKDANKNPEKKKVTFEDVSFFKGIIKDDYILVIQVSQVD